MYQPQRGEPGTHESASPNQWRWPNECRLLRTPAAIGSWNMACDSHLMSVARDSGAMMFRVYSWSRPTVSFGRHEKVVGRYDAHSLLSHNVDAVRRPTGGRALLHDHEVTYSVALALDDAIRWPSAYAAINQLLLRAVRSLGVDAYIVGQSSGRSVAPDGPPCFAAPSVGEIAVGGAKLVGSSVWRERGAYLQHGSIILRDDQSRLESLMTQHMPGIGEQPSPDESMLASPAAELHSLVGTHVTWDVVANALEQAAALDLNTSRWHLAEVDHEAVTNLQRHYVDSAWLWRR